MKIDLIKFDVNLNWIPTERNPAPRYFVLKSARTARPNHESTKITPNNPDISLLSNDPTNHHSKIAEPFLDIWRTKRFSLTFFVHVLLV